MLLNNFALVPGLEGSSFKKANYSSNENPNTYDGLLSYLLLGVISLIGLTSIIIILKKKKSLN